MKKIKTFNKIAFFDTDINFYNIDEDHRDMCKTIKKMYNCDDSMFYTILSYFFVINSFLSNYDNYFKPVIFLKNTTDENSFDLYEMCEGDDEEKKYSENKFGTFNMLDNIKVNNYLCDACVNSYLCSFVYHFNEIMENLPEDPGFLLDYLIADGEEEHITFLMYLKGFTHLRYIKTIKKIELFS